MVTNPHSHSNNENLSLEVARSLLSEATKRPWLATLLLHRKHWLAELVQCLRSLSRQTRRVFHHALANGLSAVAVIAAAFLWTSPARAGTITVDTGDNCTLAEAITSANSGSNADGCSGGSAGADTIDMQTDVTLTAALPEILSEITIEGNGHTIQRSGGPDFRIIKVSTNGNLTLKQATLTGGIANGGGESGNYGGAIAIFNFAIVTIENCTISGNSAISNGGGIFNGGTLTVKNSTVSGNTSSAGGGGIYSGNSYLTVQNSTISGNSALKGGGINTFYNASSILENSTISGNSATNGAGIFIYYLEISVKNSIVAQQSSGNDCEIYSSGTITSQGYNIESSTSCGFTGTGDQQNVSSGSLNLAALADNGGDTQTRALNSGSFAIDRIPNGTNGCTAGVSVDQRGAVRAGNSTGDHRGGLTCDVGAYEYDSEQTPTALKFNSLSASIHSPTGIIASLSAAFIALGAGWVSLFRKHKTQG